MSTQYKKSSDVPMSVLCERLSQLSDAITKGRPNDHEFTMRIPAECDRDADLVMSEAAKRLLHAEAELSILPGKWSEDSSLETWFPLTNDELFSLRDENLKLKAELESIKKQGHSAYVQSVDRHGDAYIHGIDEDLKKGDLLYKKPVYQHSFTVDGHTFYADSEADILYLERKFGVGGKAKLTIVDEEHF